MGQFPTERTWQTTSNRSLNVVAYFPANQNIRGGVLIPLLGQRTEPRTKALIRARLRDGGTVRDACILDLSPSGLLVTAARPPQPRAYVELIVGDHSLVGHVKWVSTRRFGIKLRESIDVAVLIRGEPGLSGLKCPVTAKAGGRTRAALVQIDSRDIGQLMQFVSIVASSGLAAFLLALVVRAELAGALDAVANGLAQKHAVLASSTE